MSGRLKDVKAVITGGAGAIGMATAQAFLKEGALVFVTDYDVETVDRALKTLKAGSDGMWYPRRSNLQQAGIVTK